MTLLRRIRWKLRWRLFRSPFVIRNWHRGYRITVPLSGSAAQIYYRGFSEPEVAAWMTQHIEPGDLFVDIGAHVGEYSLIAAAALGPHGEVIALEPQADLCAFIERNFRENNIPNSQVIHGALGAQCGRCGLLADPKTKGAVLNLAAEGAAIPMFDIQTLLGESEWGGRVWMKLDAAGFELPCLIAGKSHLQRHRVHLILKAYNSTEVKNRFPDLNASMFETLNSMGYSCFILKDDTLEPWTQVVHTYCDTVICLPPESPVHAPTIQG